MSAVIRLKSMQHANPYEPLSRTGTKPASDEASPDPALERPVHIVRYVVAGIATLAFLYFGYAFVRGMLDRTWWAAVGFAAISLAAVPWASTSSRPRDCLVGSLMMPVCVAGATLGAIVYFSMFQFGWFERIFNDKGSGPFGLIVFVVAGFGLGGLLAWWLLSLLWRAPLQITSGTSNSSDGG
jgi:hypothetical protein